VGPIAQIYVKERGIEEPISAYRLSAGTLKFLCLMAILLHPEPPPLICIEEPELGLHPDAMSVVADALREASGRCQVIVTTHSEALVSALSTSRRQWWSASATPRAARNSTACAAATWTNGWNATPWASCGERAKSAAIDGDRSPDLL
jgi:predicted ATPase